MVQCECNAVLECDNGCGQAEPAGFLKPEGEDRECVIDGCLVDARTLNQFAQSFPDHPSKLVIRECVSVFSPEKDASARTEIVDARYKEKEMLQDSGYLYGVEKEDWHSMVTGILVFSGYVWKIEVWATEPPDAKILLLSVEDASNPDEDRVRRDPDYVPWTFTIEKSMEEPLRKQAESMGAPDEFVNLINFPTLTFSAQGNSKGISPCDVLKALPANFVDNPLFCVK